MFAVILVLFQKNGGLFEKLREINRTHLFFFGLIFY